MDMLVVRINDKQVIYKLNPYCLHYEVFWKMQLCNSFIVLILTEFHLESPNHNFYCQLGDYFVNPT